MGVKQFFQNLRHLGTARLPEIEARSQSFSLLNNEFGQYLNNLASSNIDYGLLGASGPLALRVSTVFACVLVRGESLSSLPCGVKQSTPTGTVDAYEQPVYRLIHDKPNPFQTAAQFWKSVSAHIDLYGNAYCKVTYSGRYQPIRIDLLQDPSGVEILETSSGKAYYRHNGVDYADYEILHFKDLSLDGYYGLSKIKMNADLIGYSKKLKNYGSNAIGVKPPGYFTTEAPFEAIKKQENNLAKGWSQNIAEGKTPFLPLGMKYMNLQISPGDAQYLEAIGATRDDICAIFRVPPTLVQNYERATFANAEQQDLVFVKYTMLPIITNIEQECNAKLFPEANATSKTPYYVKFNVNAFIRGDFTARTEGYAKLWEKGLIDGDQVADLEDWPRYEGGNRRFVPMNMIPLDRVDEFIDKSSQPETQANNIPQQRNGVDIKLNGHAN